VGGGEATISRPAVREGGGQARVLGGRLICWLAVTQKDLLFHIPDNPLWKSPCTFLWTFK
jgi:hypothetical protein